MKNESISKRTFIIVSMILAILTISSLAITLFGPGSKIGDEIKKSEGGNYLEPVERGTGDFAGFESVLNYTYEGDYTSSGYDLGFTPQKNTVIGGNTANSRFWNTVVSEELDPAMEFGKNNSVQVLPKFYPINDTGDKYVFETDFKFLGSENGIDPLRSSETDPCWYVDIRFCSTDGTIFDLFLIYHAGKGFYYFSDDSNSKEANYYLKVDEWYNIRMEYDVNSNTCSAYINGYDLFTKSLSDTSKHTVLSYVGVEMRGYVKDLTLRLDNTYLSAVNE